MTIEQFKTLKVGDKVHIEGHHFALEVREKYSRCVKLIVEGNVILRNYREIELTSTT